MIEYNVTWWRSYPINWILQLLLSILIQRPNIPLSVNVFRPE